MGKSEHGNPLILGFGGGASPGSSTDQALSIALTEARRHGARTLIFGGQDLATLPLYTTAQAGASPIGTAFIDAVRSANGWIIASPGYNGCISGIVNNAIDYIENTCATGVADALWRGDQFLRGVVPRRDLHRCGSPEATRPRGHPSRPICTAHEES